MGEIKNDANLLSGRDWTNNDPKTYIVLGCPGSGTSLISNALTKMGINMGTSNMSTNIWRHEDMGFVKLNGKIINGHWGYPPHHDTIMESAKNFTGEIEDLLKLRRQDHLFGWKDPRQPLTIEAYLPYLDDDAYLICIFRKPEYVLNSKKISNQIGNRGGDMAKEYARRTIRAIMKFMDIKLEEL